jgi:hypothetical protein
MSFQYIGQWHFWVAVVIVALIVNWLWQKFYPGKGKLV